MVLGLAAATALVATAMPALFITPRELRYCFCLSAPPRPQILRYRHRETHPGQAVDDHVI